MSTDIMLNLNYDVNALVTINIINMMMPEKVMVNSYSDIPKYLKIETCSRH